MSKKDNKIISSKIAVVNQILPHVNKWAWDLFIDGAANNWMPTEISMAKDIEQWKGNSLSETCCKKMLRLLCRFRVFGCQQLIVECF